MSFSRRSTCFIVNVKLFPATATVCRIISGNAVRLRIKKESRLRGGQGCRSKKLMLLKKLLLFKQTAPRKLPTFSEIPLSSHNGPKAMAICRLVILIGKRRQNRP